VDDIRSIGSQADFTAFSRTLSTWPTEHVILDESVADVSERAEPLGEASVLARSWC